MNYLRVAEHRMFHVDDRHFVFLPAEKAIFETSAFMNDMLVKWSHKKGLTAEEILEEQQGPSNERQEFLEGLLQRRIIVPAGERDHAPPRPDLSEAPIPLSTLILHVTDHCNLGCAYCYRSEGAGKTSEPMRMSRETAFKAIDFFLEQSRDLRRITLVLFGGEPLLNIGVIRSAVEYARAGAEKKGKTIDFAVTTNGTLLTEEAASFFAENRVGVTVSIDGFAEVHDRFRRYADGRPSYEAIEANILTFRKRNPERPLVARVTVADRPRQVPRVFDHLMSLGFVEAGFAPVTTGNPDWQLDPEGMAELLAQFRVLATRFLDAAKRGEFFGFSNLIDMLVSLHQEDVKDYPCGAGLGLFSVAPNGRLYLCQRFTGDEAFCMGDVFQGFDGEAVKSFRQGAGLRPHEQCTECWMRTICTGGCYHEACVREGNHLKVNIHYCEWIKQWAEIGLEVYGRLAVSCPEFLDALSLARGHGSPVSEHPSPGAE